MGEAPKPWGILRGLLIVALVFLQKEVHLLGKLMILGVGVGCECAIHSHALNRHVLVLDLYVVSTWVGLDFGDMGLDNSDGDDSKDEEEDDIILQLQDFQDPSKTACDTDGDGFLNRKDLKVCFTRLGLHLSCFRVWRAMRHADANGDGLISEDEIWELIQYASKWGIIVTP
ncbi:hypothetical protein QVD17_10411 [Tagetes erecta]|uniref:EF-hand domain-containing protein n=1 Tax=Tagetes erecta TaxID=13708 RepID=A0AAD8NZH3_TARER|nr:hypothetical protein QVD17_10411 [Tagetes erecta]